MIESGSVAASCRGERATRQYQRRHGAGAVQRAGFGLIGDRGEREGGRDAALPISYANAYGEDVGSPARSLPPRRGRRHRACTHHHRSVRFARTAQRQRLTNPRPRHYEGAREAGLDYSGSGGRTTKGEPACYCHIKQIFEGDFFFS